jgi:hypothetical protein
MECRKSLIALVFPLLAATQAWARSDTVPGSRYTSGRGAAMGDAVLPLADDGASALFYNPAAFGRLQRPQVEPLNFQIQANADYFNMFNRNFYKVTSLSSFEPALAAKHDKFPGVGATVFPNATLKGFGFGVLMHSEFRGQSSGGTVRYKSKYQFIPAFGGAVRLASGVVRIGYAAHWVHQAVGERYVSNTSSPLGYNQQLKQGSGISHNFGFALTLPIAYLPSVNFVARNVLGVKYGTYSIVPLARNSTGAPDDEEMSFDASFSVSPKVGAGGLFNLVLEYRDLTNRSGISFLGRMVAGLEFSFRDLFFLRGGWGSGYPAAGIGLRRKTAEFALSWYSEETGRSYHSERDIRFLLHYQIRAF